jgi:ubiquinone biosynthesis protein COQ4
MPAAPIHFGSVPLPLLGRAGLALGRTLLDSTRTDEIVVAEEILAQAQLRYWVEHGVFEGEEASELLRDRAEFSDALLDHLRGLPEGSLGGAFARFLDQHALSLDALRQPTPYTQGELESYLMSRLRQCHDLWHVLMGLGTEGFEEVLVHCFSVAQTGLPYSTVIIGLGTIKHMVFEGRWNTLARDTRAAYASGRDARPIVAAYWERRWEQDLTDVRREFGIVPLVH